MSEATRTQPTATIARNALGLWSTSHPLCSLKDQSPHALAPVTSQPQDDMVVPMEQLEKPLGVKPHLDNLGPVHRVYTPSTAPYTVFLDFFSTICTPNSSKLHSGQL